MKIIRRRDPPNFLPLLISVPRRSRIYCNPFGRPASPKRRMRDPGKELVNDIQVALACLLQVVYVYSFMCSFIASFVHSTVRVFVPSFVCSFVRLIVRLIVRSFVCWFVRSFVCSFVRLFVRSSLFLITSFLSLGIDANIVQHNRNEVVH